MHPALLLLIAGLSLTACSPQIAVLSATSHVDGAAASRALQTTSVGVNPQDRTFGKHQLGWLSAGQFFLALAQANAAKLSELDGQVRDHHAHDGSI
jgi:hypothetical protein